MVGVVSYRDAKLDDQTSTAIERCLKESATTTDLTEAGKKELIISIFSKVVDLAKDWIGQIQQEVRARKDVCALTIPGTFNFNYNRELMSYFYPEMFHSATLISQILQDKFKLESTWSHTKAHHSRPGEDFLLQGRASASNMHELSAKVTWSKDNHFIYQKRKREEAQAKHLEKEWEAAQKKIGTDITFSFPDSSSAPRELNAHKAKLMMHSSVFAKKFQGPFQEAQEAENAFVVTEFSFETFQAFLQLVYTSHLELNSEQLQPILDIYRCADFYQVEAAQEWCLDAISNCSFEGDAKRVFFGFIDHTNFQKLQDFARTRTNQTMLDTLQNAVALRSDLKGLDPNAKRQENGAGSGSNSRSDKNDKVEALD